MTERLFPPPAASGKGGTKPETRRLGSEAVADAAVYLEVGHE